MGPAEYFRVLRARWAIIASAVVLALVAAWFTTTSVSPVGGQGPTTYQATAVLLNTGLGTGPALSTMAAFTRIEPVAEMVAQEIDYTGDPLDLTARVSALPDLESGILRIRGESTDPRKAEVLANEFGTQLLVYLRDRRTTGNTTQARATQRQMDRLTKEIADLDREIARRTRAIPEEQQEADSQIQLLTAERNAKILAFGNLSQQQQTLLSAARQPDPLELIQEATAQPVEESGFQPPQSRTSRLIFGGVLGLLAGVAIALLLERLNARIRTREDAEKHFGLPVLGEIPVLSRRDRSAIVVASKPNSPAADAVRLLSAGIHRASVVGPNGSTADGEARRTPPRTILVTSPAPGDGKTTVVANLAGALAELVGGSLVLSCDFRHPDVHRLFGVDNAKGLANALASKDGKPVLDGRIVKTAFRDIEVVPSGPPPVRPGELLGSEAMRRALGEAEERATTVVLDTPPILSAGDAAPLLPQVDAVLVVARAGRTTVQAAERTTELLKLLGAPIVGVALNAAKEVAIPKRYHKYRRDAAEAVRGAQKAEGAGWA